MSGGPTQIMRMEHEQMRHVIAQMEQDTVSGSFDHFLGLAETFMILVQQHNMKEEQILYNMADQILGDIESDVVAKMKAL
jgi:hemerythrin-like domain-containing protein